MGIRGLVAMLDADVDDLYNAWILLQVALQDVLVCEASVLQG